ncbi:tRNA pseudouridine(13) synthase TruD [Vibrio sp.]|nr:tRNA pseudouridine(13) synthase TruD [Vibrio sp.]
MSDILAPFAYQYGKPNASGKLKVKAEHFKVSENLGFSFTGSGEHLMLRIRKKGENTSFIANELAKACGVKSKDIGWAGLKDRHAVTEQWLSVHLPKNDDIDLSHFLAQYPHVEVLAQDRHNKKLRPGDLIGNDFVLTITEVTDIDSVLSRLELIAQDGVPNYFGQQRFGRDGNNLDEARRWGRENVRTRNQNKRSLMLSSARSWIFNRIVSQRIQNDYLTTCVIGDLVEVLATGDIVSVDATNIADIQSDIAKGNVMITAALAGDNALPTTESALQFEQPHVDDEGDLMALIRGNRMRHERRPVILKAQNLTWDVDHDKSEITLSFSLPSGAFATSIVRELINEVAVERVFE